MEDVLAKSEQDSCQAIYHLEATSRGNAIPPHKIGERSVDRGSAATCAMSG